jgi:hypothetical protein
MTHLDFLLLDRAFRELPILQSYLIITPLPSIKLILEPQDLILLLEDLLRLMTEVKVLYTLIMVITQLYLGD